MINFDGADDDLVLSVIGCGYLGAVHAASMVALGHTVVGIDVDRAKITGLGRARPPLYEPRLAELLSDGLGSGRLRFTTDPAAAHGATVHFLCVGTPQQPGGAAADLRHLDAAVTALLPYLKPGDLVVGKSTVPVGTAARLRARIRSVEPAAELAWNPEFLREGHAVADTLAPDRIVYGVPGGPAGIAAADLLNRIYAKAVADGTPVISTDYATAELTKAAANAFLATKISFINAMADLCDATGGDVVRLADALGHDRRIGRQFLGAGLGFGGGCLPKDIRAFLARAEELGAGASLAFLREVDAINLHRRARLVELALAACGGAPAGKRIAVLGAAFKPGSDDIRDSPALEVAERLASVGADVVITDPRALDRVVETRPHLAVACTLDEAIGGAELILLLTEWPEYVELDPVALREVVDRAVIIDGRNALDPARWRAAGWSYRALGRGGS
ncbi:UDP-glucose dehydrogenase family protein [Microlunatus parietis]|uniref:UDP-glucose 6-dehydrogenase n=1 Tax=Microlunatus parietis TaxID=682979 RepID=A0A7Y9LDQ1_9ACTN|nr:UDP-glucose/GDP-mannose dehydrogenase family protein [Microlunatus parietis]NYE73035.1 UDPglucose 6-dehydrogenase [Microlunatus parietis]